VVAASQERWGCGVGILDKVRGKGPQTWPPPGPITSWPVGDGLRIEGTATMFDPHGRDVVDVVGEASYQGTLEVIAGGRTINGGVYRDHTALLLPEPSNPYDVNAVRVILTSSVGGRSGKVGYLSREDAVAYRPVIDRLAASGRLVACRASIQGGWDRGPRDRGSFGVLLHMGSPADLMADLASDPSLAAPA
jgi:hypothetical protein